MMKIVLDATSIRSRPSGIGIYIQNLLAGMIEILNQEHGCLFDLNILYKSKLLWHTLKDRSTPSKSSAIALTVKGFYYLFPSEFSLQVFRQSKLIKALFETLLGKPDIFHGLDYLNYPLNHSYNILTIHDLSFIYYPQYAPDRVLKSYQKRLELCLQWTDLIITVSESTKQDIIKFFHIDQQKIWVTPLASRYNFNSLPGLNRTAHSPHNDSSAFPYLLFVSTLEPRKNIETLIKAFEILKQQYDIPHHLVLIGKKGWKYQTILETIESSPVRHYIHHLNYLSDRQLMGFYQRATAFLYPSYYEGFGLPVLEAMTFGVPVITSNQSSLPEVVGNAALLVDPTDLEGLVGATRSVIENPELHHYLSQAGQERSLCFSWQKTALKTLEAYRSLI